MRKDIFSRDLNLKLTGRRRLLSRECCLKRKAVITQDDGQ